MTSMIPTDMNIAAITILRLRPSCKLESVTADTHGTIVYKDFSKIIRLENYNWSICLAIHD